MSDYITRREAMFNIEYAISEMDNLIDDIPILHENFEKISDFLCMYHKEDYITTVESLSIEGFNQYYHKICQLAKTLNLKISNSSYGGWETCEVKNTWTEQYIQEYRDYVPARIAAYKAAKTEFTCEDLALSVLIDYASENSLPVKIINGKDTYNLRDYNGASTEGSVADFKAEVLETSGATDLMDSIDLKDNSVTVHRDITVRISDPNKMQAGDLILMDTGSGSGADGNMSHTLVVIGTKKNSKGEVILLMQQGNIDSVANNKPIWTRGKSTFGHDNYVGVEIQNREYNTVTHTYHNPLSGRNTDNAHTEFGMYFVSWDFEYFNSR